MSLQTLNDNAISTNSIIIQTDIFDRVMALATLMANGTISVPKHLQKNQADCAAIVMQSMQWGMNPWAVASKTHKTQSGILGYEAQLVNAVIMANGPMEAYPRYEFIGDWSRILGRVKEIPANEEKGKWYAKDWSPADEAGLGVICHYKIKGDDDWRQLTLMLKQCWPRFSTQWATDPQQQICYAVIKKIARRDFPGVILGVYTREELEAEPQEIDITPAPPAPAAPAELPFYPEDDFTKNLAAWAGAIQKGRRTPDDIIAMVSSKGRLTEAQIDAIKNVKPPIPGELLPTTEEGAQQ